jgi:hypothetical protein
MAGAKTMGRQLRWSGWVGVRQLKHARATWPVRAVVFAMVVNLLAWPNGFAVAQTNKPVGSPSAPEPRPGPAKVTEPAPATPYAPPAPRGARAEPPPAAQPRPVELREAQPFPPLAGDAVLAKRVEELEKRVKQLEVNQFDALDMAQKLAKFCPDLDFARCLGRRSNDEQPPVKGQPTKITGGVDEVPPVPPVPPPKPTNPKEKVKQSATPCPALQSSGGFALKCTNQGQLLWARGEVEDVRADLPTVDDCQAAGLWLLEQKQRDDNAFYVRGYGGDDTALGVCELVGDTWDVYDPSDKSHHVIVLQDERSR